MAYKDNLDYLYLIWQNPTTRQKRQVGVLTRNGCYTFSYVDDVQTIDGFELLPAFPDPHKTYRNDLLFPTFSSRLPDPKRPDIAKILQKYGLEKYDAFELLKKSEAKLPYDTFSFIDPILTEGKNVRNFYIAGTRYHAGCGQTDCAVVRGEVQVGDRLTLWPEPDNVRDESAVRIVKDNIVLGYVPRYYSKIVVQALRAGAQCRCTCVEVNADSNACGDCIKVCLEIDTATVK